MQIFVHLSAPIPALKHRPKSQFSSQNSRHRNTAQQAVKHRPAAVPQSEATAELLRRYSGATVFSPNIHFSLPAQKPCLAQNSIPSIHLFPPKIIPSPPLF